MTGTKLFARAGAGPVTQTGPGATRRVLLSTPELMLVQFDFAQEAVGELHSHPHVQACYVAAGRFDITIHGTTKTLSAGDSFIVPSGLTHGVRALEAGTLIDSFTPQRADFL